MGRWPAARGEARLNTAFHPLRRSLFASLWLGTGLLKDPLTVAGLVLLGAPAPVARASVVVVGGWLAFCMRRYGVFDVPEGPISKQVHSDLMAGAQPHVDEATMRELAQHWVEEEEQPGYEPPSASWPRKQPRMSQVPNHRAALAECGGYRWGPAGKLSNVQTKRSEAYRRLGRVKARLAATNRWRR